VTLHAVIEKSSPMRGLSTPSAMRSMAGSSRKVDRAIGMRRQEDWQVRYDVQASEAVSLQPGSQWESFHDVERRPSRRSPTETVRCEI
jgi:hypothetical protein